MPNFPKNTGFKLPGIGSREVNTQGNFRKDQKVEDVGYCSTTDYNMLPKGSSPLLATDEPKDWLVPDYYHTTYTGSYRPRGKAEEGKGKEEGTPEDNTNPDEKVDPNYGVNVTKGEKGRDATPDTTVTTLGERTGNTGKATNQAWFDNLTPAQLEEMGNPETLPQAQEWVGDYWAKKNATTTITPGVTAKKATADTYTFTKDDVEGDYKDEFCAKNPGHAAC